MGTLHCALENGADLRVNERQKIRHYRARSTEEEEELEEEECQIAIFYFARCVRKFSASKHTVLSVFYPGRSKKIQNTENWI